MTEKPHRAFELNIAIGGDSWPDVLQQLQELAWHIRDHGPECNSVSGGVNSNHHVQIRVDESMTSDRYHAECKAWLAERKVSK